MPGRPRAVYAAAAALLALACLPLLPRLDTDPSLLSYFAPGGNLHRGLERIDRLGGSSPLLLVVADPAGAQLDQGRGPAKLQALAAALEKDPRSARRSACRCCWPRPASIRWPRFLAPTQIVDLLMGPNYGEVGRGFLCQDRRHALFLLRMFEGGRAEPRRAVIARLAGEAETAGLRLERQGGLYDLQASLGELVARSVARRPGRPPGCCSC